MEKNPEPVTRMMQNTQKIDTPQVIHKSTLFRGGGGAKFKFLVGTNNFNSSHVGLLSVKVYLYFENN